ncbi:MAG: hypothetical protein FRX49_05875 [Trebouxia sp. A1-2]|nr:MAG: hypothetical protein FRX49_05875 [Trebouxia sp. A1-2]
MGVVDQTKLFWETAIEVAKSSGMDEARLRKLRSAQILRSLAAKTEFTLAAVGTASTIAEVIKLIEHQRQDFVQPGRMTQGQQDAVESQVGEGLKTCHKNIQQLQHSISSISKAQPTVNLATVAHRQGVALILNESLQGATAMFNEAREQRHQQLLHQKQQQNRKRRRYNPSTINFEVPPDHHDSANGISPPQTEGSHQELMQTESENRLLRHRLNTTRDQATGIESSLAEVAQLTELFTQQVMSQSEQIETLYDEAVAQTANIEKGNVQLKKAIKLSTSARKFTAVLMVVASLLILGFDWYAS